MRARPSEVLAVLMVVALWPGPARAQKLDKDDKKWLDDVRPLLLDSEETTYKKLKDKAERLEFQKIFWARRDPELATPANEAQEQFAKDVAEADRAYRIPGQSGSTTDCGRIYILLGKPDEVERDASLGVGLRGAETWVYKDKPGRTFTGGKAAIAFDAECRGAVSLSTLFDRIAAAKVLHPNIDYRIGKDGKLVKLVDLLPKDTLARALFKQPRQDFAVFAQASYLKVADGTTALLGLLQGDASGLPVNDNAGTKSVNVSVAASVATPDGVETGWTEQTVNAPVGADGKFLGTFKVGLKPGKYTLRAGAVDLKGHKASLTTLPIEVPDFSRVLSAADGSSKPLLSGTVLVLRQIQDLPPNAPDDPTDPFAAYRLTAARLIPIVQSQLHRSDTISFFFQVYDLRESAGAPGKAEGTARLRLLREGKGQLTSSADSAITTTIFGSEIGPIPLEKFEPGKYTARLEASDKLAQQTISPEVTFEVLP